MPAAYYQSSADTLGREIEEEGYAIIPGLVALEAIRHLLEGLASAGEHEAVRARGAETYAMRNVLDLVPAAAEVVGSGAVRSLLEGVMRAPAFPVKATLFDKTPRANWNVGWHQDLAIAVRERREVEGFRSWSIKAGVPHVQPPDEVLAGMLALRLHLDPCGPDNGVLRVLPGSHRQGRLTSAEVRSLVERTPAVTCASGAGDALLMRPLLLHASSPAVYPGHRRVLHVEFAAKLLPGGLEWYTSRVQGAAA